MGIKALKCGRTVRDFELYPAMDIAAVSSEVGIPLQCFTNHGREVLERLLHIEWLDGILCDGYLVHPLTPGSPFFRKLPYVRWSWVELWGGLIYDPCLWLATCTQPRVTVSSDPGRNWYTEYREDFPPIEMPFDRRVDVRFSKLLNKWVKRELGYPPHYTIRSLAWLNKRLDTCPYPEEFTECVSFLFEGTAYVQSKEVWYWRSLYHPSQRVKLSAAALASFDSPGTPADSST